MPYVSDRIAEVSQTRAQLEARMSSCLEAGAAAQFVRALADYVHFLTRWEDWSIHVVISSHPGDMENDS